VPGTVHLLFGAALAVFLKHPPTLVVAAFFSHYLLDFLPHIDPDTFAEGDKPYSWWQRATLATDAILIITFLIGFYSLIDQPFLLLLGALSAQAPDLLVPLESYAFFSPMKRVHDFFHWDKHRARWWSWYIPGLVLPILISVISLLIILKYSNV
jgi:hypothetical protein